MVDFNIINDLVYDPTTDSSNDIELYIYSPSESKMFKCVVEEPVVWTTEQEDNAGKLEFTVIKFDSERDESKLSFPEGAIAIFKYKGVEVFRGRIFIKQRDKDHHIACTAYDTLRYLKNSVNPRTLNMHKGTTTTKILEYLCSMNNTVFTKGDGEDAFRETNINVVWNEVDPKTYFDVIKEAAKQTRVTDPKHTTYTLYDDCGKLYYKSQEDMKLNLVIDHESLENFSYSTSLDSDTYNRVLLYWGDDEGSTTTKKKTTSEERMPAGMYAYPEKAEDNPNIKAWGLLELTKKIDSRTTNYKDMAKKLLEYHNRKTRDLTLEGCFGDVRARAGTSVILNLDLGDISGGRYGFVTKARHVFEHKFHTMDLDVEIITPDERINIQ